MKTSTRLPTVSQKQLYETGLLAVLACLAAGWYGYPGFGTKGAAGAAVLLLLAPKAYYPLAVAWFALGNALGRVVPLVLLTVLFGLLVVPVALFKRLRGHNELRLRQFKRGDGSVMIERNHTFTQDDLRYPF
jgi:hypothetical protein